MCVTRTAWAQPSLDEVRKEKAKENAIEIRFPAALDLRKCHVTTFSAGANCAISSVHCPMRVFGTMISVAVSEMSPMDCMRWYVGFGAPFFRVVSIPPLCRNAVAVEHVTMN